jgi:hypothetical protein
MLQVRSDFAAVTLEGRIFAIGGFNGTNVLTEVECYDPTAGEWRHFSDLVTPRSGSRCGPFSLPPPSLPLSPPFSTLPSSFPFPARRCWVAGSM